MNENSPNDLSHTLRERRAHYVVDAQGHPVAVRLTLEEYDHYLDLLDDEADSQDAELASRLGQAAAQPLDSERQTFGDYLDQDAASRDQELQG